MILGECAVFAAMFAAGATAGVIAVFLDVLGRSGRAARVVTDVLTAAEMGVAYFFALYHAACGVFRLYSLAAFLLGIYLDHRVCKRFSPTFRRAMRKILTPIILSYDRMAAKWEERLRPFREKRAARRAEQRAIRMEKRDRRRALREEKKAKKGAERALSHVKRKDARIVVER